MSQRTEYADGEFCWIDLMAADMDKAAEFYRALLGWSADAQDTGGGPPYSIFKLAGGQVAGMGSLSPEMQQQGVPTAWNSYINVTDVAATADKAAKLGGNVVMPPMQIADAGSMAMIVDPTGAAVSLWQKNQHLGAEVVNQTGCFCWNELATRDLDASQGFFAELLGWTYEKNDESPKEYFTIYNNGRMNGGMIRMTDEWGDVPPHWGVYFTVADVEAACQKVQDLGGRLCIQPFDAPPAGRIAVAVDAQGAAFAVIQLYDEPD